MIIMEHYIFVRDGAKQIFTRGKNCGEGGGGICKNLIFCMEMRL